MKQSVFGDTLCGVPNPVVPHASPYPSRYHGAWFGTVVQPTTFVYNPYAQPLTLPPGMGEIPVLSQITSLSTGSSMIDAAISGAASFLLSGKSAAGALIGLGAGYFGGLGGGALAAAYQIFAHGGLGKLKDFVVPPKTGEAPKMTANRRRRRLRANSTGTFKVLDGYVFKLTGKRKWRSSSDERWDTVMVTDVAVKRVGSRYIDGSRVNVYRDVNGVYYASLW